MSKHVLTNLMHTLHYAMRLPLQCFHEETYVFSLPAEVMVVADLLEDKGPRLPRDLELSEMPEYKSCLISNAHSEHQIVIKTGSYLIVCGPFILEGMNQEAVSRLIRSMHLPLSKQEDIKKHFQRMPVLTQMSAYYISRLMEQLAQITNEHSVIDGNPLLHTPSQTEYSQSAPPSGVRTFQHPPLYFENEIIRYISMGNKKETLRLLSELNSMTKARLADSPLRSLKNSMICAVTLYTRAAIKGGVPSDEAFVLSDLCIQLTERQQDAHALLALDEAVVMKFIDLVKQQRGQQYSLLIRKALQFIDEHLTESLSARALSQVLYVHPDHLSLRFKAEVGETLHRYIQRRRIEEAANFMRYSSESIASIATFYCFSSQSHFTAVFKKITGLTPQRYRNQ